MFYYQEIVEENLKRILESFGIEKYVGKTLDTQAQMSLKNEILEAIYFFEPRIKEVQPID